MLADINKALAHGLAKGTNKNYEYAVRAFEKFCNSHQLKPKHCFPADEFYLCAFAASLSSTHSGSTAYSLIAGLKAWHTMHNAPWNGSSRLQMVLRGVNALTPLSSKRPQRSPVSVEMLWVLHRYLNHSEPLDAVVFAVALVAFWGQCRLGELLGSSRLKHDPKRLPSRNALSAPISMNGSRNLTLPATKTHRLKGESIVITSQTAPLDPITAIVKHLRASSRIASSHHLFAFDSQGRNGTHCLTKEVFLNRCNSIWEQHGFPRTSGHAFRIGGTTGLLQAGVPPEVVRVMGRWASDAHFRYWRNTEDIVIQHAEGVKTHVPTRPPGTTPIRSRPSRAARVPTSSRGRPY
ncbi:hypothetical protein BDV93DRAFT_459116 [Ceratobasidium sp. AG-I]|nr:hypothetical protein BDV93DRAFT_459116 [Ceratobasidium sp. AG-I]